MALNCANWTDKQLDELSDLLRASDYSAVAAFIAENFLAIGSRIMTDTTQTTLRVTEHGADKRYVDLSAGVFLHAGLVSEVDSTQIINILDVAGTGWGTPGKASEGTDRWDIICVKNNEQLHTAADRWFVNDTVVPNTYYKTSVNTLINKAYYDIVTVHGTAGSGLVPATPVGYWTIAEIKVRAGTVEILTADIYDVGCSAGSQAAVPNWTSTSRVLRLEFWSTLFGIDHDPSTGYHRSGGWHIGATTVTTTGAELNQALSGVGATVTAANLTTLTNGSITALHAHGIAGAGIIFLDPPVAILNGTVGQFGWTDLDLSVYGVPVGAAGIVFSGFVGVTGWANGWNLLEFRKFGSATAGMPPNPGLAMYSIYYNSHSVNVVNAPSASGIIIVPCATAKVSYRSYGAATPQHYLSIIGYLI